MCMRESSPHQSTHQRHSDFMASDPSANPAWNLVWHCAFNLIDFDSGLLIPTYFHWCRISHISKMNWSADVLLWAMLQVSGAARSSTKKSKHPAHLLRSMLCLVRENGDLTTFPRLPRRWPGGMGVHYTQLEGIGSVNKDTCRLKSRISIWIRLDK